MKSIKFLLAIGLFCLFLVPAFAQNADSSGSVVDSINAQKLHAYRNRLAETEEQRVNDSIELASLQDKLSKLKTTDNLQKEKLEEQIQAINEKEEKRIAQKKHRIDSLRATAVGHPVPGFFSDTLFLIYSRLGSFTAAERAQVIGSRIEKLAANRAFTKKQLEIAEGETTTDITFDNVVVMSISENDALWNDTTKIALAERYRNIIGSAVERYQSETSFKVLAKEIGMALLVLLLIATIIFAIGRLFRWIDKKVRGQEEKMIKGIRIKNYMLFDANRQIMIVLQLLNIVKWIMILLTIYFALPVLFSIFPWTEHFAKQLLGYIISPVKKIGRSLWLYLPNLITIIVIVIVFRYALRFLRFIRDEIAAGKLHVNGFYADWANPTFQIVRVLIYAFMLVVIFPYLPGSDSPVFQGVSVFLGFLFTFGSAGSLSNIIAGFILTYMRLFKLGDRVKVGDVVGDVIEKSMLVTRVRTIKNEIISIPNSTVMSSHTINYSSDAPERGLIIHSTVTIGYDVPWRNMHQALIDAAKKTEHIEQSPLPFVLQTSLDDFYVSYQINAYTKQPNLQAAIYSNLHQNIQDTCNERGIEIMSPHYRATRDGDTSTIPEEYRQKNDQQNSGSTL